MLFRLVVCTLSDLFQLELEGNHGQREPSLPPHRSLRFRQHWIRQHLADWFTQRHGPNQGQRASTSSLYNDLSFHRVDRGISDFNLTRFDSVTRCGPSALPAPTAPYHPLTVRISDPRWTLGMIEFKKFETAFCNWYPRNRCVGCNASHALWCPKTSL